MEGDEEIREEVQEVEEDKEEKRVEEEKSTTEEVEGKDVEQEAVEKDEEKDTEEDKKAEEEVKVEEKKEEEEVKADEKKDVKADEKKEDEAKGKEEEKKIDLTPEQNTACCKAFGMFDYRGDNKIAVADLNLALRFAGLNPTNDEIVEFYKLADKEKTGRMNLIQFQVIAELKFKEEMTEEHIIQAFKVLDEEGEGTVTTDAVKDVLTNWGEPLSEKEVTLLVNTADRGKTGQFRYEDFVLKMEGKDKPKEEKKGKKKGKKKKK